MEFSHNTAKLKRPAYITASCDIVKAQLANGIVHFFITS